MKPPPTPPLPEKLAQLVQKKLIEEGLTLRRAAKFSGISFPTLFRIKNAKALPDTYTLIKLSRWLGISMDELVEFPHQGAFEAFFTPKAPKGHQPVIEVHFRCKRKRLEQAPDATKKTILKLIRAAYFETASEQEL